MIDEALLSRALDEAAAAYDEPPGARSAIISAAASGARPPSGGPTSGGRPGWQRPALAAAAVVVLLVAGGVALTLRSDETPITPASRLADEFEFAEPDSAGKNGPTSAPVPRPAPLAATDGDSATGAPGASSGGSVARTVPGAAVDVLAQAPPGQPPAPAPAAAQASLAKVVKTGSVEIVVPDGRVSATLARLETLVVGARGFVADSKTQESGDSPSGVVTMRVPGASYESMLGRVRALGEVRAATSTGADVTATFVDTEARLKTLRDTRAVYDTLLARTRSIGEVLSVQQQINGAQTQIEQLEGKLKVLNDQVTYATLTVMVLEKSDETALSAEPSRIASAWDRAKDNFGDGVEWAIAASGTVALLALATGTLLIGGWLARRALRRRLV
ncbi:MAG TPA: DUF4349 domain-containing protein [Mycobacteriales bacterium]|nr:DUF4349 domain-containing protein [Mycobacteriales bacterium]